MDKKTFLAALQKYEKVRDADYQGDLSRSIPRGERKTMEKGVSRPTQQQGRKRMDASTEQILKNSPFFNVLMRKLIESGEVPNAVEHGRWRIFRFVFKAE